MALPLAEFRNRIDGPVRVAVGAVIAPTEISARTGDARGLMEFLRARTSAVAPAPTADLGCGFELEDVR